MREQTQAAAARGDATVTPLADLELVPFLDKEGKLTTLDTKGVKASVYAVYDEVCVLCVCVCVYETPSPRDRTRIAPRERLRIERIAAHLYVDTHSDLSDCLKTGFMCLCVLPYTKSKPTRFGFGCFNTLYILQAVRCASP